MKISGLDSEIRLAATILVGVAANVLAGRSVALGVFWLIDRIKWRRLRTGRTTGYSGGIGSFNRDIDIKAASVEFFRRFGQ